MRGLGRLIALPWLLVALAMQGLAPAQAAAMPHDASGLPICSAHQLDGASRRSAPGDPTNERAHDCCAAACALAGLASAPPSSPSVALADFGVRLAPEAPRRAAAPAVSTGRRPNARGPPTASLTT